MKEKDLNLILLDEIDSTNEYLKNLAKKGEMAKTVVVAQSQTSGKGTKNRTFVSRKGGVYLSILLRPDFTDFDAILITPMTAVAVSDAIAEISNKQPQIKWVNDLYLDGKKVCGILCESGFDCNQKQFIIVGIGVNLFRPINDFDEEIKDIATSVFDAEIKGLKQEFITILIDKFFKYFNKIKEKTFLEKYKNDNLVIGKEINFCYNNELIKGRAISVDDNCRLIVELPDKSIKTISSGDVEIKL